MNPFLVLGIHPNATDEEVRTAYRALLRRYTPEHRPVQFQIIQEAYDALRTQRSRLQWRLLHLPKVTKTPLEVVQDFAHMPGAMRPPGAAAFRSFLSGCASAAKRAQSDSTTPKPNVSSRP